MRYILERVEVDGQNVVNTGQQRYTVEPDDEWEVELLLFTARLMPRDALFGFSVGDAVAVSHPNGEIVRIPAGDGEVTARWLARGIYRVSVPDAPGWSPITPFALSRDQDVALRVITYLDMAVVGLGAAGLAWGFCSSVDPISSGGQLTSRALVSQRSEIRARSRRCCRAARRPDYGRDSRGEPQSIVGHGGSADA